jgi:hypothetical protein
MDHLTPLDVAQILEHSTSRNLPRDSKTGLYIADGTEPPTVLTLPLYEAALKVLDLRARADAKR